MKRKFTPKQLKELREVKLTMEDIEELKNIKVAVRWGKNGRKYIWENPTKNKITELIKKYDFDQICDGCLWLCQ